MNFNKTIMSTALVVSTLAVSTLGGQASVEAAALKWNLQNVGGTFNGNNFNVNGSFVYDDSANTYSNISILSTLSSATYDGPAQSTTLSAALPASSATLLRLRESFFFNSNLNLVLAFAQSLAGKAVGNSVLLDLTSPLPRSGEALTNAANQFIPAATVAFSRGSVVAVPTPALLPGLAAMGLAMLRKRKAEAVES